MYHSEPVRYEFEGYVLLPLKRLLLRGGETVPLKPKVFETLFALVQNHGRSVSKEDFSQIVWGGRKVEEGNLSHYIFTLRKLFGESPQDHRFIVTVPGYGYRFAAEVKEIVETNGHLSYAESAPQSYIKSLAVLPLKFLAPNKAEEYLGLAIADTLITQLSGNKTISVRSTATVLKYNDTDKDALAVGRELAVDAVVSGTLQRFGSKIRINVQLTRVQTRETIWANKFEAQATDLLKLQDEVAEEVSKALTIEIKRNGQNSITRTPKNHEVYQTYIKGRYEWEKRTEAGLQAALDCVEEVISAEPDFPLGYIGVADSYLLLGEYLFLAPDKAFPRAREAAEKALKLEPALSEGYASLAEYYFYYKKNWEKAEEHYERSIKLNPRYASARHWYTWFLIGMNRFDEAQTQIEQAQSLEPNSLILTVIRGLPFYFKRQFDRAARQFRRALEIEPNVRHAHYYLGSALVHAGEIKAAIKEFEKILADDQIQQAIALLGYCHAVSGDKKEAQNALLKLDEVEAERYVSPYVRAFVHTGLGETGEALKQLERAYSENAAWLVWLDVDPFFDSLREEARFKRLIKKLAFPIPN